ncbi:hypothetical protein RF11_04132 [Thelohanellus kitauei]|uniref:Uncharacterized protein n=1 Tax=Thelohanellus kitauei TaxID=669202 RepID=A0A0C2MK16_THEKT|nr:hypothetical protein RF11_04132 [Thelohanellus kitauei]
MLYLKLSIITHNMVNMKSLETINTRFNNDTLAKIGVNDFQEKDSRNLEESEQGSLEHATSHQVGDSNGHKEGTKWLLHVFACIIELALADVKRMKPNMIIADVQKS